MKVKIIIKTWDEKKELTLWPNWEWISDESEIEIRIEKDTDENKKE